MQKKLFKKAMALMLAWCLTLGGMPTLAISEESLAATPVPSAQATAQVSTAPADETAKPTAETKPTAVSSSASVAPTAEASAQATEQATQQPTQETSVAPTAEISAAPTQDASVAPTAEVTAVPTAEVSAAPTAEVTAAPTAEVSATPTAEITAVPTAEVSAAPTVEVTVAPTAEVSPAPTMPVAVDAPAVSENARAVQALLDALPSVDALATMDEDGLAAAYKQTEVAYEAYLNLTSEEQSQILGAEKFAVLFGVFNGEVETLAAEYPISVDSDVFGYGRAEIVGGLTSATEGDTVTVKFIPNEGYEVDFTKVKITTKLYDVVDFTKNEDGTISFTMPDQGVSIEPAFKPVGSFALELMFALLDKDSKPLNNSGSGAGAEDTSYGTVNGGNNVSFSIYNDAGRSVYLLPGSYSFKLDHQYIGGYADADDITFTFNLNESGEISVSNEGSGVADVSVNRSGNLVNFEVKVNQIHTVELIQPENGSLKVDKSEAMQGETVTITLMSNDKTVNYAPVITEKSTGKKISYTDMGYNEYSFTMPDDDVQVATVAEFYIEFSLTVKDDVEDNIGQDKWVAYLKETNFKIVYSYISSNLTAGNYTIGDFKITTGNHVAPRDISFTVTEDGRVTISERDDLKLTYSEKSNVYNLVITVPRAEGVYAAFTEKTVRGDIKLRIEDIEGSKTDSIVEPGKTVTVTLWPNAGFQSIIPTVTTEDGKPVEVVKDTNIDDRYTFVMPESDLYVTNAFQGTFSLNITLRCKIDGSIYYDANSENIVYLVDKKEEGGQARIESGKVNSIGLLDGDHTLYYLAGDDTMLRKYCEQVPNTINFHVDANAKVTSSDVEITQNGNSVIMSIPLELKTGYYGLNVVTSGGDKNCSASFDNFCAQKDETVKLNVSAATEEYRAGIVRVTDANGNALALTQVEGGYTFTMPESRVTAEVKFVPKYNVTVPANLTGGSVKLVDEATRFFPGDEVHFTVESKDDNAYYLQSDSVAVKCGETPVAFTANEGDYSFIMPEGDVTITAAFGRYKFTLQYGRITKEFEVPEASDDPASAANTFMSWLKAKNMFSNATTGWRLCRDEKWESVNETTIIRKGDVFKLAWMVEAIDSVLVIYDSCTVEELSGVASDNYRLEEGGSVTVSHKVDGESREFVIQKDHYKVLERFDAAGIDAEQQWYWYYNLERINAVTESTHMPIKQANFSRAFAATLEQTGGDASCTASLVSDSSIQNAYLAGETVTVQLNRSEESAYGVYSVSVTDADGGNVALTENNGNYCFTMPAKAVNVKVEWRKRFVRNFIFDFQDLNGKTLENLVATVTLNGRGINGAMDVCVGENELKFTQLPEDYKLPEVIRFTMKEDGALECTAANVQMSSEDSDIHVLLTLFKENEYRISTTVQGAGSAFAAPEAEPQKRIQGAEKGETVCVNTIPDNGYALSSVKVLDAKGKELECNKNIRGFYYFTMPECDVSVVVQYKQYYDGIKTLLRVKNHRGALLPQDDANKVAASIFRSAEFGARNQLNTSQSAEEVQAYGYFADEYKLDSFNFEGYLLNNYKKPDALYFSVNEDGSFTSKNPQLEVSWDQNKKELTLTVILQKKDELYDVYLQSSGQGTLEASTELTQEGRTVKLYLNPESDYIALEPTVKTGSGDAVSLTRVSSTQYDFTMPGENVYVSVTFIKQFSLKLQLAPTLQGAQYTRNVPVAGYLDGDVNKTLVHEGSLVRTLHEGEHTLTITHLPSDCAAPENLTFKVDEQGNLTSESMAISKSGDCWLLGVPLELAQGRYALKLNIIGGDAKSYTVNFNELYSGKAGESMYLYVDSTTDSPYMVESVVLTDANGTVLEVRENGIYYYFTMPESEVTGTVTFARKPGYYDVLISSMENGAVTADKLIAKAGEEVKLTIEPAKDYKLNMLTVTNASGEAQRVLDYAFTMPESDVTISALFTKSQGEAFSVYFQIQGLSTVQCATYMTNFSNWLESYNESHPLAAYPFGSNCYWRVKRSTGVYEKVTASTAIQGNDIFTLVWEFGAIPTVYAPCTVGELSNEMLDAYAAIQFKNDGSVSGTHIVNESTVRFVVSEDGYRIFDFLFDHGFDPYLDWLVDLKVVENALNMSMPLRQTKFDSRANTGRYPITCYTAITNGGIVQANGTSSAKFAKDTSISLNVQPDEGYRLKSLTVQAITANGAVPIQLAADYSFLMPAYAVEVRAEFELGDPEFVITIPASVDLDQASSMSVSASGLKYMEGKKLIVDVESENNYRLVQGENSIDYSVSAKTVYFTLNGSVDLTFTLGDTSAGLPMGEYEDTLNFTVTVRNYSTGDGSNADSAA